MTIIRKLSKIRMVDLISLIKLILAYPFAVFIKIFYKDLWLITERKDDARDNGYHLFRFIRLNYPNKRVFYAINTKASDFKKINELGNYIEFGSFKHYIYYLAATKNISSQIGTGEPNGQLCLNLEILGVIKNTKVFLQHGVIKDILNFAMYKNSKIRMFICGARKEYEFVKENFGYPEGWVRYLGLCRFDGLHNTEIKKKQILIMPTWRQWLNENIEDLLDSDYFRKFNDLINNKRFLTFIKDNNLKVVFYPHDNMQKYIDYFKSSDENLIIAKKNDYDVQELLKESALLITDYSSVFFDFAYMRKPTIYYQFDFNEYRKNHYQEGYFNYERDSFGPVCYDFNNVLSELEIYFNNNFTLCNEELLRINSFFPLYDDENCKRTYQAINEI